MKIFNILGMLLGSVFLLAVLPGWTAQDRGMTGAVQGVFLEEIPDWQARWELARLLSYTERYAESEIQYRKVLKERPDQLEAKIELARVLFWKGDTDEAEKVFSSIPTKDLTPEARLEMAEIYLARNQYVAAADIYLDHLVKNPGDHRTRFKLAQVLSWKGDYDASLNQYQIILDELPSDVQVRRRYAQVLVWAERFDEAIIELERTLED